VIIFTKSVFQNPLIVPPRSYFTGGGEAACNFKTRTGSSDALHEGSRKSGSHSRGALLDGMGIGGASSDRCCDTRLALCAALFRIFKPILEGSGSGTAPTESRAQPKPRLRRRQPLERAEWIRSVVIESGHGSLDEGHWQTATERQRRRRPNISVPGGFLFGFNLFFRLSPQFWRK
jgi:hypothetical protein